VNILYFLVVAPTFWYVSHFTTAFLFLLKKKSLGGNYSIEIGVKSFLNIIPALGFPFVDCKGVTDGMGLPISLDACVMIASMTGSFDGNKGVSPTPFEGVSV
jgi:hypothetical protein